MRENEIIDLNVFTGETKTQFLLNLQRILNLFVLDDLFSRTSKMYQLKTLIRYIYLSIAKTCNILYTISEKIKVAEEIKTISQAAASNLFTSSFSYLAILNSKQNNPNYKEKYNSSKLLDCDKKKTILIRDLFPRTLPKRTCIQSGRKICSFLA